MCHTSSSPEPGAAPWSPGEGPGSCPVLFYPWGWIRVESFNVLGGQARETATTAGAIAPSQKLLDNSVSPLPPHPRMFALTDPHSSQASSPTRI